MGKVAPGKVVTPKVALPDKLTVVRGGVASSKQAPKTVFPAAETLEGGGRACVVCLERLAVMALLPCGHRCVCARCSDGGALRSVCPMCRADVENAVRVFDS
ncbi:hypothetical protein T484DRAFT_1952444 [Baffinella frigidus]|nr:hypothetical protein T484DRAFT_1952444 [Cryptophyta sp. CCMP2293]